MIDIEHPAYSLIKAAGVAYGFSPEEGESWASVIGDPHEIWGAVQSDGQAEGIGQVLRDCGMAVQETIQAQPVDVTLMTIIAVLTQHSIRLAEYSEANGRGHE